MAVSIKVRKRCLACGRTALYQRGVTACERRFGYGNLGHECRGPLETVRRKAPTPRQQTPQETARRVAARLREKIGRLLDRVERDTSELRATWRLLGKYEARALMSDAEVAAEYEKRKAAAAKALETRTGKRRRLALEGL